MRLTIRKKSVRSLIAFALGMSVCTNVIYAFQIGNTYVLISYAIALIGVIHFLMNDCGRLIKILKDMDKSLKIYSFVNALSVVMILVTYGLNGIALSIYFKGLIVYACGLMVYLLTVYMEKEKQSIINGVYWGIILNTIYCMICYIAFNKGFYFSLYEIFPQKDFSASVQWGVSAGSMPIRYLIYSYRAQGLFLEASHYAGFLIALFVPILMQKRNNNLKHILIITTLLFELLSATPNFIILIIEMLIVLLFLCKKKRRFGIVSKRNFYLLCIGIAIFCVFIINIDEIDWSFYATKLHRAMISLDVRNVGNSERYSGMLLGFNFIKNNPLGIGYNLESFIFNSNQIGANIHSAFSFALRLLIETGPIGLISYLYIIVRYFNKAYKYKNNTYLYSLGIACISCAIMQFGNGITILPYVWVLLGLIEIESENERKNECKKIGE